MECVNEAMKDMAENIEDDDFITTKDISKLVLVATSEEFIVTDRDKFKNLEISKRNRFLV
jgi:hypothetical protein